jgi:hypothetical protein
MFEQASRLKLRYETCVGSLAPEDLWDLPLTSKRGPNLNDIAIGLHNQLKHDTVSFVEDEQRPDARLQLRFEIVKHVIGVKKEENRLALEARDRAEKKQKIMSIIARKQDEAMESMDEDKLRELLAGL